MADIKPEYIEAPAVREKSRPKSPPVYNVYLLNDDYTTMDFVVRVLEEIFHKNPVEATRIMLFVHKKGRGLAGVYDRQIAEAKISAVHSLAEENGFPLKCEMERQ